MRQILDVTDADSKIMTFLAGGTSFSSPQELFSRQQIAMSVHNGGEWVLHMETPDGIWIPLDEFMFSKIDVFAFWAEPNVRYQLRGGDVGAKAWVSSGAWRLE